MTVAAVATDLRAVRCRDMARYQVAVRTRGSVLETIDLETEDLKGLRVEVARFVGQLLSEHADRKSVV